MADDRTIGAIVVGTNYGVLTHTRAMQNAGMRVLALVGRDEQKPKRRAERLGVWRRLDRSETNLSA